MPRNILLLIFLFGACFSGFSVLAQEQTLSLQIESTKVRKEPKVWSAGLADLAYGDTVQVVTKQQAFFLVRTKDGIEGFVHETALTPKKVVLSNAPSAATEQTASQSDILLAGKGFNKEAESDLAGKDPSLNFAAVDELEKKNVNDQELRRFMEEGGLRID